MLPVAFNAFEARSAMYRRYLFFCENFRTNSLIYIAVTLGAYMRSVHNLALVAGACFPYVLNLCLPIIWS